MYVCSKYCSPALDILLALAMFGIFLWVAARVTAVLTINTEATVAFLLVLHNTIATECLLAVTKAVHLAILLIQYGI